MASVRYTYDTDGKLTRKQILLADGTERIVWQEEPENENPVVKFTAGGKTVTSHSKNDSFGRKVFDELQLGTGFVSRQFHYLTGTVTNEHVADEKLKSSPTIQLVSQIVLSGGRTLSYEYDAEERITKVTDSVDGVTQYTYDAMGQLLTETVNDVAVNTMVYDNYGNIVSKNGKAYTYGDAVWKDLLTAYDGTPIVYDEQGNPTSYLGHTLTWEKGRQLKSFDNIQYTYNANGIRTSKTVDGVRHDFTLDGVKILREAWCGNTLIPLYNNEDEVCGIQYNNVPYYFQKNLQGDVIAITDQSGATVATYTYDAWGVPTITSDTSACDIANRNPFRYRSYYFDSDTGLYYLRSRYYGPVVCRFLNADEIDYLDDIGNLMIYCQSNPVNHVDYGGRKAKSLQTYLNLKNGKSGKLKVTITNNSIKIVANFIIFGSLAMLKISNKTYFGRFSNGIQKFWKGNYKVFGYNATLNTTVHAMFKERRTMQGYNPPNDRILAMMHNEYGISYVAFPVLLWNKDNPGTMCLFKGESRGIRRAYTADQFERVCAHEFGHILGLSDLYGQPQKIINKYSPKGNRSIMSHQWEVSHVNNFDLEKALSAFKYNRKQWWT